MFDNFKDGFGKTLRKLFTLVVDRRLLVYLMTTLGMLFGFPELVNNADSLNQDLVEAITMIIQGITVIVGLVTTLYSWTKRPPSGLEFDAEETKAKEIHRRLRDIGLDV